MFAGSSPASARYQHIRQWPEERGGQQRRSGEARRPNPHKERVVHGETRSKWKSIQGRSMPHGHRRTPDSVGASVWAVVLAGGDGMRLRSLTRLLHGDDRPKQFATLIGSRSLLGATLDRVERVVPAGRTMLVTRRDHRALVSAEIGGRGYQVLEQPASRGTAAAIVLALLQVTRRDPAATVVIVPSDHHVSDDAVFGRFLRQLVAAARSRPDRVMLVGVEPTTPEPGFGWIEPGLPSGIAAGLRSRRVRRFLEKPSPELASELHAHRWLWNSMIVAGRAALMLDAARSYLPEIYIPLERAVQASDRLSAGSELQDAYAQLQDAYAVIPSVDFSRDLLEVVGNRLDVVSLPELGWSDLGTPVRVLAAVQQLGTRPAWAACLEASAMSAEGVGTGAATVAVPGSVWGVDQATATLFSGDPAGLAGGQPVTIS